MGRVQPYASQSSCTSCAAGQYQDNIAGTACKICAIGMYQTQVGQDSCVQSQCTGGLVNANTSSNLCVPCGAGKIKINSVCTQCDVGQYQDEDGQTTCKQCQQVGHGVNGEKTTCDSCVAGKVSIGQGKCELCENGKYQPETGQNHCHLCSHGKRSVGNRTVCEDCPIGKYGLLPQLGGVICRDCPQGRFQARQGQTSCYRCPRGFFTASSAESSCTICSAGNYSDHEGASSCQPCSAGKYSSAGASVCQTCDAGKYSAETGANSSTTCQPCVAGKYSDHEGASSCQPCSAGKYSSATGSNSSATCLNCVAGKYSTSGASACQTCAADHISGDGAATCQPCGAGERSNSVHTRCLPCWQDNDENNRHYYRNSSAVGDAKCSACPNGQFLNYEKKVGVHTEAEACIGCPPGSYLDFDRTPLAGDAFTSIGSCSTCPQGKYNNESGQFGCRSCPNGTVSSNAIRNDTNGRPTGWSSYTQCYQIECNAGEYFDEFGTRDCKSCPNGWSQYWPARTFCDECGANEIANSARTGCQACSDGKLADRTSNTCFCPAGKYVTGDTCTTCAAGKYSLAGPTTCTDCVAGKYSTYEGATTSARCQPCAAGKYSLAGAAICTDCVAGKYSIETGAFSSVTCIDCVAGKYSLASATTCQRCSAGKYSGTQGASVCQPCDAGTYSAETGANSSATCLPCVAGKYSLAGAATCQPCDAGKYSNQTGATTCQPCDAGTYSSAGATTCSNCIIGKYSGQGSISCDDCPIGTYSDTSGTSVCKNCQVGKFGEPIAQDTGVIPCQPCVAGKYSDSEGATSSATCQPCVAGKYSDSEGATSSATCQPCVAGKYSLAGAAVCQPCVAGKYSDSEGAAVCQPCGAGKYSASEGSAVCQPCVAGKYSASEGATSSATCANCDAGKYSDSEGAAVCQPCVAGKYSTASGANSSASCLNCVDGKSSDAGATACQPCTAGSYPEQIEDLWTCTKCAVGRKSSRIEWPAAGVNNWDTKQSDDGNYICHSKCQMDSGDSRGPHFQCAGECRICDACKHACTLCAEERYTDVFGVAKIVANSTDDVCTWCKNEGGALQLCEPQTCPSGFGSLNTGDTADNCEICPQGQYSENPICIKCPAGKYSGSEGANSSATCKSCVAGKYSDIDGAASEEFCQHCPTGKYGHNGSATCKSCDTGTYSDTVGATSVDVCKLCPKGKYQNKYGQSSCKLCSAGQYQTEDGKSSCKLCSAIQMNSTTCTSCPAGKFGHHSGACQDHGPISKLVVDETVNPNTFTALNYMTNHQTCGHGSYVNPTLNQTAVTFEMLNDAVVFGYDRWPGQNMGVVSTAAIIKRGYELITCIQCPQGKYSKNGSCVACDVGKYNDQYNQSSQDSCKDCSPGRWSALPGQAKCCSTEIGFSAKMYWEGNCIPCPSETDGINGTCFEHDDFVDVSRADFAACDASVKQTLARDVDDDGWSEHGSDVDHICGPRRDYIVYISSQEDCDDQNSTIFKMDACGVCGGDNTTCDDCGGQPGGGRIVDMCGECGGIGPWWSGCSRSQTRPQSITLGVHACVVDGDRVFCHFDIGHADASLTDGMFTSKTFPNLQDFQVGAHGGRSYWCWTAASTLHCQIGNVNTTIAESVTSFALDNENGDICYIVGESGKLVWNLQESVLTASCVNIFRALSDDNAHVSQDTVVGPVYKNGDYRQGVDTLLKYEYVEKCEDNSQDVGSTCTTKNRNTWSGGICVDAHNDIVSSIVSQSECERHGKNFWEQRHAMQIERSHCRRVVGSDGCLVSEFNTKVKCESTGGIWDIDPSSYCRSGSAAGFRCIVPDISVSACSAEKRYRWFPSCVDNVDNTALHYIDNTPQYYSQQECEAPKMKLIFDWSIKSHIVAPVWGVKQIESSGHFLAEWNTYYTVSEAASGGVQYDTFYDDKTTIVKIENDCVQRVNNRVQCTVPSIEMVGTLMASKNGHACVKNLNNVLTCWFNGIVDASYYIPSGYTDVVDVDIYKDMACGVFEWPGGVYKISCWGNTTSMDTDWTFERFCQGKPSCDAAQLSQQWFSMNDTVSYHTCDAHFVDIVSGAQPGIVMPDTGSCPNDLPPLSVNHEQRLANESGCLNPKGCNYDAAHKFPAVAGSLDDCWYPFNDADYTCPEHNEPAMRQNPYYIEDYGGYGYNPGKCRERDDNNNGWCDALDEVYGCTHTGACNSGILSTRSIKKRVSEECVMDDDCASNRCLFCKDAYRCSREKTQSDTESFIVKGVHYTCEKDAHNREYVTVAENKFCRFPYGDEYGCKRTDIDFVSIQGTTNALSTSSDQNLDVSDEMRDRIRCVNHPKVTNSCPIREEQCPPDNAQLRDGCCVCGGGRIFDTSRGRPINDMTRDGRPDSWLFKGSAGELCCDYNPFNLFSTSSNCTLVADVSGTCAAYTSNEREPVCNDVDARNYLGTAIDPVHQFYTPNACKYDGTEYKEMVDTYVPNACMQPDKCNFNPFATSNLACQSARPYKTCNGEIYSVSSQHCSNVPYDIPGIELESCKYTLLDGQTCTPTCRHGYRATSNETLTCVNGTLNGNFSCVFETCVGDTYYDGEFCVPLTVCNSTEHIFQRASSTSDRICVSNVCVCEHGTADIANCTTHGETKCLQCNYGYHSVLTSENTTDCAKNICQCDDLSQVPSTNCSDHGATECQACPGTQHALNGTCVNNNCTCANGVTRQEYCVEHNAEICEACDEGYFLNQSARRCQPYLNCTCPHGVHSQDCQHANENKCVACDSGYQLDTGAQCQKTLDCQCQNGQPATTGCDNSTTHKCSECDPTHFLNATSLCQPLTVCLSHQFVYQTPQFNKNRICKDYTLPAAEQYIFASGDNQTDNDIRNWTQCSPGQYESRTGTNRTDRTCSTKQCTCTYGTAASGAKCPQHQNISCDTCFGGYRLVGNDCKPIHTAQTCSTEDHQYEERSVANTEDILILTNGVPNHTHENVCARPWRLRISRPERSRTFTPLPPNAPMGILKSGGFLYSSSNNHVPFIVESNVTDICNGRLYAGGTYTYSNAPKEQACGLHENCQHIGYMNDGFPIYSECHGLESCYQLKDDADPTLHSSYELKQTCSELDAANGFDFTDANIRDNQDEIISGYAYVVSSGYPFIPLLYAGKQWYPITAQCQANQFDKSSTEGCVDANYVVDHSTQFIHTRHTKYSDTVLRDLTECADGFYTYTQPSTYNDRVCKRKICTCTGGLPAAGTRCPENNKEHCLECNNGISHQHICGTNCTVPVTCVQGDNIFTQNDTMLHSQTCTLQCETGYRAQPSTCNNGMFITSECLPFTLQPAECERIKDEYSENNCMCHETQQCVSIKRDYNDGCK